MKVYTCTTTSCTERFRGFTDAPSFCSVCMEDLTEIDAEDGSSLDELNAMAERVRPLPEGMAGDGA